MLDGRPVLLQLEEPARFALYASPRAFAVLCWQLIRNACQQLERGAVVVTVLPGAISVANRSDPDLGGAGNGVDRHGFELAIAQRISERLAWPLELASHPERGNVARIRFPEPLPADS